MFTRSLKKILVAVAIVSTFVTFADIGRGQASDTDAAQLRKQLEQLKKENQELRQSLTQAPANAQPQPIASVMPATTASSASSGQELAYWLTTSSSKRHNSRCRWFHNSKGRRCGPNEGIACKQCGG